MSSRPPWGWWRSAGARSPEDAAVVADWMEEQGYPAWAAWFRAEAEEPDRFARFFGEQGAPGLVERVFCGAIPVASPTTAFDGPWFTALHAVSRGPGTFDFAELAEVPCMARLAEIVVHGAGADDAFRERVAGAPIGLGEVLPLGETLTGLWVLDGRLDPDGLAALPRLTTLQACLGPGRWSHPTLRHLGVLGAPAPDAELDLPSLTSLDLDPGHDADIGALLRRDLPALERIELDGSAVPQVAAARRAGALPRLGELLVWGRAEPPLDGVAIVRRSPWERPGIRLTSPWVFDWGIVLPP